MQPQSTPFKRCSSCGELKPMDAFGYYASSRDGRRGVCKPCRRADWALRRDQHIERAKAYYQAHREERIAANAAHYAANRDVINARDRAKRHAIRPPRPKQTEEERRVKARERARRWYAENTERAKSNVAEYARQNAAQSVAWRHTERARRLGATGTFTGDEWLAICDHHDNRCAACASDAALTVDHIVPLSEGGTNMIANIQPLCRSCNSRKNNRVIDYRRSD